MRNTQQSSIDATGVLIAAARRNRSRGSVLIFVVAILTLLALIGTAFMATVRIDRYAAPTDASNSDDTASDLLSGLQTSVTNAITADVYDGSVLRYRPGTASDTTSRYEHWDSGLSDMVDYPDPPTAPNVNYNTTFQADTWLGERLPTVWDPTIAPPTPYLSQANPLIWRVVPRPLNGDRSYLFESPYYDITAYNVNKYPSPNYNLQHDLRVPVPASVTITYPTVTTDPDYDATVAGKTRVFPAFHVYDINSAVIPHTISPRLTPANTFYTYLAADADGDGIADSGLWRLGDIDGVTYYAAYRVVDNNSAINVNTAISRDYSLNGAGVPTLGNPGYFTSNIGLRELFQDDISASVPAPATATASTGNDGLFDYLNYDRYNMASSPPGKPAASNAGDFHIIADEDIYSAPNVATPAARTELYSSQAEEYFFQLGRRLGNPGYRVPGVVVADNKFKPYITSQVDNPLSFHFGLINPLSRAASFQLSASKSDSSTYMDPIYGAAFDLFYNGASNPATVSPKAMFNYAPPNETLYWYYFSSEYNINVRNGSQATTSFGGTAPARPVRNLLTASNPVSNHIPIHTAVGTSGSGILNDGMTPYVCKGRWSQSLSYNAGDVVRFYDLGITPRATNLYVCTKDQPAKVGGTIPPAAYWTPMHSRGEWISSASYNAGDTATVIIPAGGANKTDQFDTYVAIAGAGAGTVPASATSIWKPLASSMNPPKTSLNTGSFSDLWRGFWNVMAQGSNDNNGPYFDDYVTALVASTGQGPNQSSDTYNVPLAPKTGYADFNNPYLATQFSPWNATVPFANKYGYDTPTGAVSHPLHMFRSSLRDFRQPFATAHTSNRLRPVDMVQLRSALAAANAEAMRNLPTYLTGGSNPTITQHTIYLHGIYRDPSVPLDSTPRVHPMKVTITGQVPQPYITEIYANNDTITDYSGNKGPATNPAGLLMIEIFNPYPAGGPSFDLSTWKIWAVSRRGTGDGGTDNANLVITTPIDLTNVTTPLAPGSRIVLRNADATDFPGYIKNGGSGAPTVIDVPNLASLFDSEAILVRPANAAVAAGISPPTDVSGWIPVDSYDFTGIGITGAAPFYAWHYVRQNSDPGVALTPQQWTFVYPGRYDASHAAGGDAPRQQGTQVDLLLADASTGGYSGQWDNVGPPGTDQGEIRLGLDDPRSSYAPNGSGNQSFYIPLADLTWPSTSGAAVFPYNGFAAAGEVMKIPFVGSYIIQACKDSVDGGNTDENHELLGTSTTANFIEINPVTMDSIFAEDGDAPLASGPFSGSPDDAYEQIGRFCPLTTVAGASFPGNAYDDFADVLEHFTAVHNYGDDFSPNIDPSLYGGATAPAGIANTAGVVPNGPGDQDAPVQGLININTAPWPVLAMAPLALTAGTNQVDQANTVALAKAIVAYRNQNGPYKSLFDLNKVILAGPPAANFQTANGNGSVNVTINSDFTLTYQQVSRLSNILTVRSDAFTCFLLVQGWKHVGTKYPQIVTERRSAFIVDRSNLSGTVSVPLTIPLTTSN